MKKLRLLGFLFLSLKAFATDGQLTAENSNYVVIGAFASQENAKHFVQIAKEQRFDAHFEMNTSRHLFYVYVLHTGNKKLAIEEAIKLRQKTAFWDTWVFSGLLGQENASNNKGSDYHPETGEKLSRITADDNQLVTAEKESTPTPEREAEAAPAKENTPVVTTTPPPAQLTATETKVPVVTDSIVPTTFARTEEAEGDGKHFVFKIYRSSNNKAIDGEVDIIDPEKKKKMVSYKGNRDVVVRPVNKSGEVSLECEVFGYRKIERKINLKAPQAVEGITMENDQAIIPFELTRLKKGDYAIMYNVYFFKDAAIMKPESRYELNSLRDMLKENPKYKIRIHGHTNGNAPGTIIEPGESKDLFSLTGTKESYGTAKTLSEERAITIYDFLIAEGIDASRMLVKGWGGKKPIFDKDHTLAHSNVRVEIEIVAD